MARLTVMLNSANKRIGQSHQNSKLTDNDVDLVFELRQGGMSLVEIGEKFNVGKACIWKIVSGHSRSHIPVVWRVEHLVPNGKTTSRRSTPSPNEQRPQPQRPTARDPGGAVLQATLDTYWR